MKATGISCVSALLFFVASGCERTELPPLGAWAGLQAQLDQLKLHPHDCSHEAFLKSPTYERIAAAAEAPYLMDMIKQVDARRYVALAGFLILAHRDPESSYKAAIHWLVSTKQLDMTFEKAVWKALKNPATQQVFEREFPRVLRDSQNSNTALNAMMAAPYEWLYEWYHNSSLDILPEAEAYLISLLVTGRNKPIISKKMSDTIDSFAAMEGVPRLVFVEAALDTHPKFNEVLTSVLKDESEPIARMRPVILRRRDYILAHVDLEELGMSDERLDAIKELLNPNR